MQIRLLMTSYTQPNISAGVSQKVYIKIGITLDCLVYFTFFSFLFAWFQKYVDIRSRFDVTANRHSF